MKIKIAIDSGPLSSGHAVRGIGVHTRELIEELKKIKIENDIDAIDFSQNDLSGYDLVHYPYFSPFFVTLPFKKPAKKLVLTIHDLIPLIFPKEYPPGIKGSFRFLIQKFLLKNVDAIITISETSKKDICRFLPVQSNKVHVVYLAPKKIFKPITDRKVLAQVRKKYGLPERLVLYVGDVNYNKNILGLAEACKIAKLPLMIVGKQAKAEEFDKAHPENRSLVKLLEKYGNDKNVLRPGFVPEEEIAAVFNLASVYCQPSFYEGFGLPLLEAMAAGIPVVASKIQAHVEIAEGAIYLVDPKNPKDIAKGLTKVVSDKKLANDLIKKGFDKTKIYSWTKTAEGTFKVYEKILG